MEASKRSNQDPRIDVPGKAIYRPIHSSNVRTTDRQQQSNRTILKTERCGKSQHPIMLTAAYDLFVLTVGGVDLTGLCNASLI